MTLAAPDRGEVRVTLDVSRLERIRLYRVLCELEELMVKIDELIVLDVHLLVQLAQASLHTLVLILDSVKLYLQIVVLVCDFFHFDLWLDNVTSF